MSGEQTFIRKNNQLLKAARELFGKDVVADAWVTTYYFNHEQEQEALDRLHEEARNVSYDGNRLDLDSKTYYIKMANGNVLEFTNSEWGAIRLVKESSLTLK